MPPTTSRTRSPENSQDEWNWARTHRFSAASVLRPTTVDDVLTAVVEAAAAARTLRCVGTRHSFTDVADSEVLLDLSALDESFLVNPERNTVTVTGAMTYSRVCALLEPHNLALANLASLPHLSVAGAISTATHGSGDKNKSLAAAARSVEVVTPSGSIARFERGEPGYEAAAISFGALGPMIRVELDVEPAYEIEQVVHDVRLDLVGACFDDLFGCAYSVSAFTNWSGDSAELWTKRRTDEPVVDHGELHDGIEADGPRHPVPGEDPLVCTQQAGIVGSWAERLPHFRANATPSVGAEVQSEFFVERTNAMGAIQALRDQAHTFSDALMVSEIRTVGRDGLWMSPQHDCDNVAFHFTWHHDVVAASRAARAVAIALQEFSPRPHWGKVFDPSLFDFERLFPRLGDALAFFERHDPNGMFRNEWMRRNKF